MTACKRRPFRHTVLLASLCALAPAAAAREVALISGTGFRPSSLAPGSRVAVNTRIEADHDTIVVLTDRWGMGAGKFCEDWVIVRGRSYTVQAGTPGKCRETGRGDELGRAMAGTAIVGHVRVLQFSDAKSDLPTPPRLKQLYRDLSSAREQAQAREEARERAAQREREAKRMQEAERQRLAAERERERQAERARELDLRREQVRRREAEAQRREREAERNRALEQAKAAEVGGPSSEDGCQMSVLKVAQNEPSDSAWWTVERIGQLCAGTQVPGEPIRCLHALGRAQEAGAASAWTREEMLQLCQGTSDSRRTIGCYKTLRERDVARDLAIRACSGGR